MSPYISICLTIIIVQVAAAALPSAATFELVGEWRGSRLSGHKLGVGTYYASSPDAAATWRPALQSVTPVRVSFWVTPHPSNAASARIEAKLASGMRTIPLDLVSTGVGWQEIGTFSFSGEGTESFQLLKSGAGNLRLSALRLEIIDPQDPQMVWQTLIFDQIAAYDQATLAYNAMAIKDIAPDNPLYPIVRRLVAENILSLGPSGRFNADFSISRRDFLAALERLGSPAVRQVAASTRLSLRDALTLLVQAARASGKPLNWAELPDSLDDYAAWSRALGFFHGSDDPLLEGSVESINRAQAARLLSRYQVRIVHAGPRGMNWQLAFHDAFEGDSLDPSLWQILDGDSWGKLLSVRMRSNVEVADGLLRLVTRKEAVQGKEWTTGFVTTAKYFRQAYGYWEARIRYANAPGLNNAFWTNPGTHSTPTFEIDINEGHWPNIVNASLHQQDQAQDQTAWRAPMDLSRGFHIYACRWTEDEIIYYWDGEEIGRKANTHAQRPGPVMFSTAVFPWAGPITDALDGTAMEIDWVRIWCVSDSPDQQSFK